MKMVFAILQDPDAEKVTHALNAANFKVTRIASTGGLLKRGVVTLLMGVEDDRVDEVIQVLQTNTTPLEGDQKRLTLFVVPVEKYIQV